MKTLPLTPQHVEKIINNIISLLDTIDDKSLIEYHHYISELARGENAELGNIDKTIILAHIFGLKMELQNRRIENQNAYRNNT